MNDKSKASLNGTPVLPQTHKCTPRQLTAHLLTPVTVISQLLQLQLQGVCAGVRVLLQQLKLGSVDLRQADVLGLHLQPALSLETTARNIIT